jgi:hypothetical protein
MFRTALFLNFESAKNAVRSGNTQSAAALFADAMMLGYRHFRDLSPADPTIMSAARVAMAEALQDPDFSERLSVAVLNYIRNHDSAQGKAFESYYQKALECWMGICTKK